MSAVAEQLTLRRRLTIYAVVMLALGISVLVLPDFSVFPARSPAMLQLHMVVELFAVSVAAMVAALAASSMDRDRTGQSVYLAAGFGSVAVLDGIHALSSEGMPGALVTANTDHAFYYWLLGRTVTAVIMLAVAMNLEWRQPARRLIFGTALVLAASLWIGEASPHWVPDLYRPDEGVTLLKSSIEVALALAFVYAGALLLRRHDAVNYRRNLPLAAACLTLAMGEALLVEFLAPTSLANIVGHALKLVAYGFIYSAIFLDGIRAPMRKLEHAIAALRESEARLRALADNLPDGLIYQFTRDAQGRPRFLHMSRAVQTMHQISAEEAMRDGSPLFKQILAEDMPTMLASEAESRRTMQPASGVIRFCRPDGQIRHMLFSSRPRTGEDGQIIWDGVQLDVTRHEQTREALEHERARLRGIIDSAMDGILSLDNEQRIVLVNRAAERIFGYPADALLGQPVDRLLPARFRDAHRRHLNAFREHGASARAMGTFGHVVGLRADGTEVPLEASIARLSSEGQSLYLAIVRDVSARVEADAARLRLE
ncbi:MAG: MASE3 domain-containing protein [Burkholderiales bacterium]|nr:MASE3 domain-containing protein [Burkholderiales bacterium]